MHVMKIHIFAQEFPCSQNTSLSARWRELDGFSSASDLGEAAAPLSPPSKSAAGDDAAPASVQLPQRPFGPALEGLAAAYERAALGSWAEGLAPAAPAEGQVPALPSSSQAQ